MESQEGPSAISLFVYFSIASCLLYLGAVVALFHQEDIARAYSNDYCPSLLQHYQPCF